MLFVKLLQNHDAVPMIDSDTSVQYQGDRMFGQVGEKRTHIRLDNGPKIYNSVEMEQICKRKACHPSNAAGN
jgi:hypothetical protein